MSPILLLWPLSGIAAWVWIMCRNRMVRTVGAGLVAALMTIPFCIGGPAMWLLVALAERYGRIQ